MWSLERRTYAETVLAGQSLARAVQKGTGAVAYAD